MLDIFLWKMNNELHKLEELDQCKEVESFCVNLIYEFLVCNGFTKTASAFTEEVKTSKHSLLDVLPERKDRIQGEDVQQILSAMEMEDHLKFFEQWSTMVPPSIKELPDYKNITLPLYTYFATLPARKGNPIIKKQDSVLKDKLPLEELIKENEKKVEKIKDLKLTTMNSTFTLEKPSIPEKIVEVGYTSERDVDIDPDSLESEMELSDSEGTKKQKRKKAAYEETAAFLDTEAKVNGNYGKQEVLEEEDPKGGGKIEVDFPDLRDSENGNNAPSAMDMFQEFLLEKKNSFNTDPQYLPLFALPFIQNPESHEAFKMVFQDKWVKELKDNLVTFLINYSCGDIVLPDIVKICKEHKELAAQAKTGMDDEYLKMYKEIKRKLHKLKRDHKNLVGVAGELATALENSVRGEAVDIKATLYKCIKIFPELFPNIQDHEQMSKNGEVIRKIDKTSSWIGVSHLDTKKIKYELENGSIKAKLLLMQALRWGLCSVDSEERDRLIEWLRREDILGLEDSESGVGRGWLGAKEAHPLQQGLARLLNNAASLRAGRDWLVSVRPSITPLVANSLMRVTAQDRITQDMLLAVLHKLTLKKAACEEMIHLGVLDWLTSKLEESAYQLEYCISLFMNLSIHAPVGYWDTRPHQVLPPLFKLLSTSEQQVLEMVLASLYCVLRSDKVNIFARSLGLSSELNRFLQDGENRERIKRQVSELLRLHRRELPPHGLSLLPPMISEEDIEDPEEMEAEINADDPVKGTPCGNELLAQSYSLIFPAPSVISRGNENNSLHRPSTPQTAFNLPPWAL